MLASRLLISIPQAIRIMRKFSTDCLDGSVTVHQLRILVLIKEGLGPTQLGEALQISPAAISKMVSGLENKKFVVRRPGKDKRSQVLKLTPEGKKMLTYVQKHVEKKLNHGISQLDINDQKSLQDGLSVLNRLMSLVQED